MIRFAVLQYTHAIRYIQSMMVSGRLEQAEPADVCAAENYLRHAHTNGWGMVFFFVLATMYKKLSSIILVPMHGLSGADLDAVLFVLKLQ